MQSVGFQSLDFSPEISVSAHLLGPGLLCNEQHAQPYMHSYSLLPLKAGEVLGNLKPQKIPKPMVIIILSSLFFYQSC